LLRAAGTPSARGRRYRIPPVQPRQGDGRGRAAGHEEHAGDASKLAVVDWLVGRGDANRARRRTGQGSLLRQPYSFERLIVVEIGPDPRDLAIANIEDLPHRLIDPPAAARSAPFDPAENENLVLAEVAEVLAPHAVLLPGVADITKVRLDAPAPPQSTAAEAHRHRGEPFDIRAHALEDRIGIAPVEGVDHPLGNLHVLLRHRLLDQPHGFERLCSLL